MQGAVRDMTGRGKPEVEVFWKGWTVVKHDGTHVILRCVSTIRRSDPEPTSDFGRRHAHIDPSTCRIVRFKRRCHLDFLYFAPPTQFGLESTR